MKAYVVLALIICGNVCQTQAATLSKPEKTAHALEQLLEEESVSANERGHLVDALRALNNGEETEEGYFLHLIPIAIRAIVHAVRAGAQAGRAAVAASGTAAGSVAGSAAGAAGSSAGAIKIAAGAAAGGAVGGVVGSAAADKIRKA